jgi:hypothetical protein
MDFSNGYRPRFTAPNHVELPDQRKRPELPVIQ